MFFPTYKFTDQAPTLTNFFNGDIKNWCLSTTDLSIIRQIYKNFTPDCINYTDISVCASDIGLYLKAKCLYFPSCTLINAYAFKNLAAARKVIAPNCVEVGSHAFEDRGNLSYPLEEFYAPNCRIIRSHAFLCQALHSITIDKCEDIGDYGLAGDYLTSVYLPNCQHLGIYPFGTCKNLSKIVLGSTSVVTLNGALFSLYAPSAFSVYVPASLLSDYKVANNWSVYSDKITAIES